jgi:hypothetical protein
MPSESLSRLAWHPVTIAGCLAALALPTLRFGWLAWLVLGAVAGFATSGSV